MKKKILFLIHALNPGGAQKVLVRTVNALDPEKYEIIVKTIYNRHELQPELNCNIKLEPIIKTTNPVLVRCIGYIFRHLLPSAWVVKFFIGEDFDYQVAFLEGEATKLLAGSKVPRERKVAWVHCNMMELFDSQKLYQKLDDHRKVYLKYGKIICVSRDSKKAFIERFGSIPNVEVLHNVIDENRLFEMSNETPDDIDCVRKKGCLNIIQVGNCRPEKSYDRMFSVCKKLREANYSISLTICGSGVMYEKLVELKREIGLDDCVTMLGNRNNPYPYIKNADLLVCSSRSEAFSTVVIESLLLDCPVLTTDCSGMAEILEDGKYGIIVQNSVDGLYYGLCKILDDPQVLVQYKSLIPYRKTFFSKDKSVKELERIFL